MDQEQNTGTENFGDEVNKTGAQETSKEQEKRVEPLVKEDKLLALEDRLNKGFLDLEKRQEEFKKEQNDFLQKISEQSINTKDIVVEATKAAISMANEEGAKKMPEEPNDPDDWDENGVTFYAFVSYTVIGSDKRKGVEVFPPRSGTDENRLIHFAFDCTKRVQNGKQEDLICISKFTSNSNKLTEWMRKDSRYNVFFFETLPARMDHGTIIYVQRVSRYLAMTKTFDAGKCANTCTDLGIPTSMDLDEMRQRIALTMAEKDFIRQPDGRMIPVSDYNNQAAFMGKQDKKELLLAKSSMSANPTIIQ